MQHHEMPIHIGKYTLHMRLTSGKFSSSYYIGIYKNTEGKELFVKRWEGKRKNIAYKWLKNEAAIYRVLSNKQYNVSIRIPKFVDEIEDRNSLSLIVDHIKGEDISRQSVNKKIKTYQKILSALAKSKKNNQYTRRPPLYWIGIVPIISLVAIIKNLKYWRIILRGLIYIMLHAMVIVQRKRRSLVHRDLNDNNVISNSHGTYLIDYELAIYADPMIDLAILLLKNNSDSEFITRMKQSQFYAKTIKNKNDTVSLITYMTIFSVYDLCFSSGLHTASIKHLGSI